MNEVIKRESTWDYETYENGYPETTTVETIETWEYSEELKRYELVQLEEKDTGISIPYNESTYIQDGAVDIPGEEQVEGVVLNNINEACEYVRENNETLEITKEDHEFLGHDDKMYPARATLIVENDGSYYISDYDYYDSEKEEWIDTEDRTKWTHTEINDTFFPYEVETTDEVQKESRTEFESVNIPAKNEAYFPVDAKLCAVEEVYRNRAVAISQREEFINTRCKDWHIVLHLRNGKLSIMNFNTSTSNYWGMVIAASFYTKKKAIRHFDWVSNAISEKVKAINS